MSKVEFTYYLHDTNDTEERCETIVRTASERIEIDDEMAQKIGRPFYEVALSCTLDTETGEVQITGAEKAR